MIKYYQDKENKDKHGYLIYEPLPIDRSKPIKRDKYGKHIVLMYKTDRKLITLDKAFSICMDDLLVLFKSSLDGTYDAKYYEDYYENYDLITNFIYKNIYKVSKDIFNHYLGEMLALMKVTLQLSLPNNYSNLMAEYLLVANVTRDENGAKSIIDFINSETFKYILFCTDLWESGGLLNHYYTVVHDGHEKAWNGGIVEKPGDIFYLVGDLLYILTEAGHTEYEQMLHEYLLFFGDERTAPATSSQYKEIYNVAATSEYAFIRYYKTLYITSSYPNAFESSSDECGEFRVRKGAPYYSHHAKKKLLKGLVHEAAQVRGTFNAQSTNKTCESAYKMAIVKPRMRLAKVLTVITVILAGVYGAYRGLSYMYNYHFLLLVAITIFFIIFVLPFIVFYFDDSMDSATAAALYLGSIWHW